MNKLVFVENQQVVTDSLTIAEMFGKEHRNVLRDIETQINYAGEEFTKLNFEQCDYTNVSATGINANRKYKKYNLTEEAFTLVVFSYNTKEAVQTKIKFIQEFKRMREYIEQQQKPKLPTSYKEALLALVEEVEKNEQLQLENTIKEQQIAEMQPKVTYVDKVLSCSNLMTITQIADDYGMSAVRFNKLLNEYGIQYKQSGQWLLYSKYKGQGYTKSETKPYPKPDGTEGISILTKWTQKGRLFLYEKLKAKGIFPTIDIENSPIYGVEANV